MTITLPILYSFRRCPYAMRARMALIYADIQCQLREVDLADKPAHLLTISPKATVPVLLLPDQIVIDESLDIMQWAAQQHDPNNIKNSLNDTFIDEFQNAFNPLLRRFKYSEDNSPEYSTAKTDIEQSLQDFDKRLTKLGHFESTQWGLTDLALFPFIRQCSLVDPDWFADQKIPKLQQWLHQQLDSDLFKLCMQKEKAWQPNDVPILFPSVAVISDANES